ncbi:hypothetical protein NBZ79_18030 [Sneathiella marina]|uniref:Uncharacterized protein n=1 Tax=Sneathiella marina TaxID=2950108 RepID=A0ABY4W259_9PROT|nr:hypothetical protein [Sneathiella marina]USG61057.1 hypothetical protein NBZ79_18030 [Sneathiella marina]
MSDVSEKGMTTKQARRLEYGIIGFCLLALVSIFQPFSQALFTIGCISVVVGGLAFNLVPFCVAGNKYRDIAKSGMIVVIVFVIVVILALASAWGYGVYLRSQ